ncbi:MAG: WcaF family extracellular polysaccharide biosynthesis acetyltransferase [Chthoniobacteraceae bacterium]
MSSYSVRDFDRGAPKWLEVGWVVVKNLIFLSSWPWPSALKVALLRAFGAKVGTGVVIRSRVNITFPWRVTIGNHVWIGDEVFILSLAPVTIGSNVCISQRAFLCAGSHDFRKPGFDLMTQPITIGDECWVASQVFVAAGVEIGARTVVGAGGVVVKSLPPGVFAGGNPAKVVRTRDEANG